MTLLVLMIIVSVLILDRGNRSIIILSLKLLILLKLFRRLNHFFDNSVWRVLQRGLGGQGGLGWLGLI